MKLLFIDIEATGDGSNSGHTILSIGGIIVYDTEVVEKIQIDMKPKAGAVVDFHKKLYLKHLNSDLPSQKKAFEKFNAFLDRHVNRYQRSDKLIGVAYNASFEQGHLVRWFEEHNHKYLSSYIIPPLVCTQQLSVLVIPHILPLLEKRNLSSVATVLDIEVDSSKLHTALYDAQLCMRVYFALLNLMQKKLYNRSSFFG